VNSTHEWTGQLPELISDGVRRILAITTSEPIPADRLDERVDHMAQHAVVTAWQQRWASTSGPHGGYAGQAITMTRIVRVTLEPYAAVYSNGVFLYLLDPERGGQADAFNGTHVPYVDDIPRWWEQP
jgi:hypothetical protein